MIDHNDLVSNKYITKSSKGCILEIDLGCPKKLYELYNVYHLAPDKIEIKNEMEPSYQVKFTGFYDIPFSTVKKLLPNFFDKEKYVLHYENLQL